MKIHAIPRSLYLDIHNARGAAAEHTQGQQADDSHVHERYREIQG